MLNDVVTMLQAFSSLATMIEAVVDFRRVGRELGREESRKVLAAGEQASAITVPDEVAAVVAKVIPQDILEGYIERIKRARKRYVDTLKDVRNTPAQIDQETRIAQAEICAMLQLVSDHNNGNLPGDEFDDLWQAFRCGQPQDP